MSRASQIFAGDDRHGWYFRAPDGESYDAFAGRVADWLSETTEARVLVVVTHGMVSVSVALCEWRLRMTGVDVQLRRARA